MFSFFLLGPSRSSETITTTTTTVTSTTTTRRQSKVVKKKVQKRRRKVQRRRRTYVVEYDIDDYNNKFGIKTAKRVIRKRRRKTKRSKKRTSAGCGRRRQAQNRSGSPVTVDGIMSGSSKEGLRTKYLTLHLFGNKNALEYFSDGSDNDEGIDSLNNSMEAGDGLLVMSAARSNPHRNLMRRKNVAINSTVGTAESGGGIDILSNIMDTMNRWHSMSKPSTIEKIRISADGTLECETPPARTPQTVELPNSDILNAPTNPRNEGASNRNFNNSNGFRGNNTNQSAANYSSNTYGGQNEPTSFQPFQRAGNLDDGGIGSNFQPDNFSPRNRVPFQRQRNNANNSRLVRNQFQPTQPLGLYDGEDILPTPNVPTQCKYSQIFKISQKNGLIFV